MKLLVAIGAACASAAAAFYACDPFSGDVVAADASVEASSGASGSSGASSTSSGGSSGDACAPLRPFMCASGGSSFCQTFDDVPPHVLLDDAAAPFLNVDNSGEPATELEIRDGVGLGCSRGLHSASLDAGARSRARIKPNASANGFTLKFSMRAQTSSAQCTLVEAEWDTGTGKANLWLEVSVDGKLGIDGANFPHSASSVLAFAPGYHDVVWTFAFNGSSTVDVAGAGSAQLTGVPPLKATTVSLMFGARTARGDCRLDIDDLAVSP